jgi:serine kinase of HPr protein (carbohydrate metabolism regulator)
MILHAGCITRPRGGDATGVLVMGPSGSGKSDLMLRLVARGWRLVADDRAHVWVSEGRLYARAPDPVAGLIEVRGVDIARLPRREVAPIRLLVVCLGPEEPLDRLPERQSETFDGIEVERLEVRALEASAPLKVELALARQKTPF